MFEVAEQAKPHIPSHLAAIIHNARYVWAYICFRRPKQRQLHITT
jgi:hypothetical protein